MGRRKEVDGLSQQVLLTDNYLIVIGAAVVSHSCPNDNTVEGLTCLDTPAFSVQYHPEAAAGPHDAAVLFDEFVALMDREKGGKR